jgi:hypothetical protein
MRKINGFENYKIDEFGNVYRIRDNYKLIQDISKKGYARVKLTNNIKRYTLPVHRLVALTYLDKVENKNQVNHIDCNKLNNHISNLEWCDNSHNQIHAYRNGLNYISEEGKKRISDLNSKLVLDTETGIYYKSSKEASIYKNINYYTLNDYLNNKVKNKTSLIYV